MAQVEYTALSAPLLTKNGDLDADAEATLIEVKESLSEFNEAKSEIDMIPQEEIHYKDDPDQIPLTSEDTYCSNVEADSYDSQGNHPNLTDMKSMFEYSSTSSDDSCFNQQKGNEAANLFKAKGTAFYENSSNWLKRTAQQIMNDGESPLLDETLKDIGKGMQEEGSKQVKIAMKFLKAKGSDASENLANKLVDLSKKLRE